MTFVIVLVQIVGRAFRYLVASRYLVDYLRGYLVDYPRGYLVDYPRGYLVDYLNKILLFTEKTRS